LGGKAAVTRKSLEGPSPKIMGIYTFIQFFAERYFEWAYALGNGIQFSLRCDAKS